jgi:hypothetical protein
MRAQGPCTLSLLLATVLCLCLGTSSAQASRSLLTKAALFTNENPEGPVPPP